MQVKKILLIDDEEFILMNLQALFEDEGYNVVTAATGEDGLDKISTERDINVAIVDWRLPGMDGNEVIKKGCKVNPNIKFCIYTGSGEYSIPEELSKVLTPDDIIYKPVTNEKALLEYINKYCEKLSQ